MYRIRRFGVIRTATVVAVAYAIAFAIILIPIALIGLAVGAQPVGGALTAMVSIGVVLVVVYPLLIWVATAIACLIYNLAARWVGGIEIDVERPTVAPPPRAAAPWPTPGAGGAPPPPG